MESKDEIYGSAYATAVYLSSVIKLPKTKKVYVIGMAGLEEELHEEGVEFIGGTVGTQRPCARKSSLIPTALFSSGSCGLHRRAVLACQFYS